MTSTHALQEGFIPFRGYQTWYQIIGDAHKPAPGKFPVLALHGSPVNHYSLEPLARLIETGRPVIFYDQLGCGQSSRPDDPALGKVALFVDQVAAVREALGLDRIHLFGHSLGGMLALEYALRDPAGVMSLTLHSTHASFPLFAAEWDRLRGELPAEVQATLARHEAAGSFDDPEYRAAQDVFDQRHIWRLDPLPDFLHKALENMQVLEQDVDDWDVRGRLGEITLPTLITSGRYDVATPMLAEMVHDGIAGSEWVLFEESSHYAHVEEEDRFLATLDAFLARVEGAMLASG